MFKAKKTLFIKLKSYVIVIVVFDSAHADDFFDIDGNFFHQIQFHGGEVIHDKVGSLPSLSGLPLPSFQSCGVFNVSDLGFDRSKASIGSSVDLNKMVKISNRLLSFGLYLEQLTDSGDSVRVGRGQGISMVGKSWIKEDHLHLHRALASIHGVLGPLGVGGTEVEVNVAQTIPTMHKMKILD